ncbi:MAG: hypothetical protein JRH19_22515, partial [Deltaproteobacteria bacterium]|nr:hypothetical protein [Deltaproteobacteria bacterium]
MRVAVMETCVHRTSFVSAFGLPVELLSGVIIGIIAAWSAPAGELDFEVVRVTSGLTRPVYLPAAPGDAGRALIVEQHGGT